MNSSMSQDYVPEPERNRGGRPRELGMEPQRFVMTLPAEEYGALKAAAQRSQVPTTRLVRHALRRYLHERGY
jgi:hypothetical protein